MPAINASDKTKEKAEPGTRIASRLSLVPLTGLEPVRCCQRGIFMLHNVAIAVPFGCCSLDFPFAIGRAP